MDHAKGKLLAGRHALVTGGGSGIGAAIARRLASEGATVTISGRDIDKLEATADNPFLCPVIMDVTDEESVKSATDVAVGLRGPIAIHVANAGIAEGLPFEKMGTDFWRNIMSTNLDGSYFSVRESLKSMRTIGWGRIIAVSSIAGLRAIRNASAYTASKHGILGLIRALSSELSGSGITANALCPGYVDTPLTRRNVELISSATGLTEEEALKSLMHQNPHNRFIAPKDIAAAVIWLCQPESGSVNGQAIPISGGEV